MVIKSIMTEFTLDAYSLIFSEHAMAKNLEHSNKILISASVLPDLDINSSPILFQLKNKDTIIHCGMHEYVDSPGLCFVPHRYLTILGSNIGTPITVSQITDIPDGTFLKIKPFETAFIHLSNPKTVLENYISSRYPVLSQGEIITIQYLDHEYEIEIVECQPNPIIKTINCDINLEFEEPYDYVEEEKTMIADDGPPSISPEISSDPRFPGIGRLLGSS